MESVKSVPTQSTEGQAMPQNNETRNMPSDGVGPGFKVVKVSGSGEGSGNGNTTKGN